MKLTTRQAVYGNIHTACKILMKREIKIETRDIGDVYRLTTTIVLIKMSMSIEILTSVLKLSVFLFFCFQSVNFLYGEVFREMVYG